MRLPDDYSASIPPAMPVTVDLVFAVTEVVNVDDKKNVRSKVGSTKNFNMVLKYVYNYCML